MRLGDLDALRKQFDDIPVFIGMTGGCVQQFIDKQPTIDAVPEAQIEQVKNEILTRMDEFIAEHRRISESTVDHFGGKADAMDVARRLVNAALIDLCAYGERKDGE